MTQKTSVLLRRLGLGALALLLVWHVKEYLFAQPHEMDVPIVESGLVRFEKVASLGHHNWPGDEQGNVVALLPSGKVALVSNAPMRTDAPERQSLINMFVLEQNHTWIYRSVVFTCPKEFSLIDFKLSGNGKTLVVGCGYYFRHSLIRVFQFRESDYTWSLDPFSLDDEPGLFGHQVAVSFNGRAIAIGSPLYFAKSKVLVVQKSFLTLNSYWHRFELVPSDLGDVDNFASRVEISGDGNTVAVAVTALYRTSVVFVFRRTDLGLWQQQGPMLGRPVPAFDNYPHLFLAISFHGRTIASAVGRCTNRSKENVQIFDQTITGEWHKQGTIVPYDSNGFGNLGQAMSLSSDGNLLLACAPYDDDSKGTCWVFARLNKNSKFVQQGPKYQVNQDKNCGDPCLGFRFGHSAQMFADASAFIVGGNEHPSNCDFDEYNSGCYGGGAIIYRRSKTL